MYYSGLVKDQTEILWWAQEKNIGSNVLMPLIVSELCIPVWPSDLLSISKLVPSA